MTAVKDVPMLLSIAKTRLKVLLTKQQAKSQTTRNEIADYLSHHKLDNARYRVSL